MKAIFILSIVVALAAVQAEDKYSTENDNFDIDAVVSSLNTLKAFNGCFLETVTCDPVAGEFKKDIAEAVEQACSKCTQAQKHIFKKFLDGLQQKLPQEYQAFKNKYDPEGKHFTALEKAVAAS